MSAQQRPVCLEDGVSAAGECWKAKQNGFRETE